MRILGVSASSRKWGNTEILVRHVLWGAAKEGAEINFLRLHDFRIHQCKGCLSCLFKDRECVIGDGLADLMGSFRQADGIVLASPVYSLFAAGAIQIMIPRFFRQVYTGEFNSKLGVAIAVGGRRGWEGLALPQLSTLFLSLGMPIVDQFIGYAQGPGEIFYDKRSCQRALDCGKAIANGESGYRGNPGACPVCHFDLVVSEQDDQPRCILCDLPGFWVEEEGLKVFKPLDGAKARWGSEEISEHFEKQIIPSGERFLSRKIAIQEKLKVFRENISTCHDKPIS